MTEKSKTSGRKLTELRESAHQLLKESELSEANGDEAKAEELHQAAQLKEIEVMKLLKWISLLLDDFSFPLYA